MKYLTCILIATALVSCSRKQPIDGGGFNVICVCWKDSTSQIYTLGNRYQPYDSITGINRYYSDSCTTIKNRNSYDSGKVKVLAL